MKVGRRLALKVLNATKFALGLGGPHGSIADITEPLDAAMINQLASVVEDATEAFHGYSYNRSLERVETFFWQFCDDYLELVKVRAYSTEPPGGRPGRRSQSRYLCYCAYSPPSSRSRPRRHGRGGRKVPYTRPSGRW